MPGVFEKPPLFSSPQSRKVRKKNSLGYDRRESEETKKSASLLYTRLTPERAPLHAAVTNQRPSRVPRGGQVNELAAT